MKLPANPVKPYIRHKAHTLRERGKTDQGTGLFPPAPGGRPAAMRPHSAALAEDISSGRLRNHGQKKAHQSKPSPARTQQGVAQSDRAHAGDCITPTAPRTWAITPTGAPAGAVP